jgi:hypothetical protein
VKAAKKKPKYERSAMVYIYKINNELFTSTLDIANKYGIARTTAIDWTKRGFDNCGTLIKRKMVDSIELKNKGVL